MQKVITIRLEQAVKAAAEEVAEAHGRDFSEQIVFYVVEGLIADGALPAEEAELHKQRERLIREFLDKGSEIDRVEGHRDDMIAETARRMGPEWHAQYASYIGARDRNTINPTLGRRLKLLLKRRTGKTYAVRQPHIFASSSYLHADEA